MASGELLVGESPEGVEFFDDGKFHKVLAGHVGEAGAIEANQIVLVEGDLRIRQAHEFGLLYGLPFAAGLSGGHGCDGKGGLPLDGDLRRGGIGFA